MDSETARYRLTHLKHLEAEAIHIMREVVMNFSKPVMLFSVGKDSMVMLHLARKAFHPSPLPLPLAREHHLEVQGNDPFPRSTV